MIEYICLQVVDDVLGADDNGGGTIAIDVLDFHPTFAINLELEKNIVKTT